MFCLPKAVTSTAKREHLQRLYSATFTCEECTAESTRDAGGAVAKAWACDACFAPCNAVR